jgi:hypothetical protein
MVALLNFASAPKPVMIGVGNNFNQFCAATGRRTYVILPFSKLFITNMYIKQDAVTIYHKDAGHNVYPFMYLLLIHLFITNLFVYQLE